VSSVGRNTEAARARETPSSLGPDIDLEDYKVRARGHRKVKQLADLPENLKEPALDVGVDAGEECRAGSFFQVDHSVVFSKAYDKGLQILSISEAARKYDWLDDYRWSALSPATDKYTAQAVLRPNHGYFIRALPGTRVEFPLQACLFMTQDGLAQNVHNVIVAEEGSELHIITGCGSAPTVRKGLHVGITEFYVKQNATMTFTMIHSWGKGMSVRPRSAAVVEANGVFISNYVSMKPVKTLQMYPVVTCVGENATVRMNSILLAPYGTDLDVGMRVFLKERGCRAEIVSRAITTGGTINARGHLVGTVPGIRAHLECRGLILSEGGKVHAIPELEGQVEGVDLSHEAAVGRIAEEQITYLMARGLTEDEATAAIVRGFLDVRMEGLPRRLADQVREAIDMASIKGL
jgi:Fe-S cluster assembly scaffold protein SufB